MRHLGGKHQRSAFGGQHKSGLRGTVAVSRSHRRRGGQFRGCDRRQRHHHHRLRAPERGRRGQSQVQRVGRRQRQSRNVAEVRRVHGRENLGRVHNGPDVGRIGSAAAHARGADGIHQVGGRTAGQLRHQGLGIRVVQHHPLGVLRQASGLLLGGLFKALLFQLDAQAARGHFSPLLQRLLVRLRGDLHLCQVGFHPHAVPTGRLQVLYGAHKGAGFVVHGFLERVEISACLRHQEDQRLLCFTGHGDKDTLAAHRLRPCFHARKPLWRGRVCDSTQKSHHQHNVF